MVWKVSGMRSLKTSPGLSMETADLSKTFTSGYFPSLPLLKYYILTITYMIIVPAETYSIDKEPFILAPKYIRRGWSCMPKSLRYYRRQELE